MDEKLKLAYLVAQSIFGKLSGPRKSAIIKSNLFEKTLTGSNSTIANRPLYRQFTCNTYTVMLSATIIRASTLTSRHRYSKNADRVYRLCLSTHFSFIY